MTNVLQKETKLFYLLDIETNLRYAKLIFISGLRFQKEIKLFILVISFDSNELFCHMCMFFTEIN